MGRAVTSEDGRGVLAAGGGVRAEDGAPKQSVVLAAKNSNRFSQLG